MALSLPLTQGCLSHPFPGSMGEPGPRCPSLLGEVDVSPGCVGGAGGGGRGSPHGCGEVEKWGREEKRAQTQTGFAHLPQCFENLNPCLCSPLAARAHAREVTEVAHFLAAA